MRPGEAPSWAQTLFAPTVPDNDGTHEPYAALGAVYRAVTTPDGLVEYYYDALGRRRLKRRADGSTDEYFHSGTNLLEDRGVGSNGAAGRLVLDEYVWLDGRPVALLKSRLGTLSEPDNYFGESDATRLTGSCGRFKEEMPCGVYFPVVDPLGKPVLLLDSAGRVAGSADYEPFGHVNRVTQLADTPHPYPTYSNSTLAYLSQPPSASTAVRLRAHFSLVETEGCSANLDALGDYAFLADSAGGPLQGLSSQRSTRVGGIDAGATWTDWVQVPDDGKVQVRFVSDGVNQRTSCGSVSTASPSGVVLTGYEYQRYEKGASPVWLPLRFPGQYHDRETDLFENWNRFYDPSIGRYLGPEPMLENPKWVLKQTAEGQSIPAYAYANNNPLFLTDPDGLKAIIAADVSQRTRDAIEAFKKTKAGAKMWEAIDRSNVKFVFKDGATKDSGDQIVIHQTKVVSLDAKGESGLVTTTFDWAQHDEVYGNPDAYGVVPRTDTNTVGHEVTHQIEALKGRESYIPPGRNEVVDAVIESHADYVGDAVDSNKPCSVTGAVVVCP